MGRTRFQIWKEGVYWRIFHFALRKWIDYMDQFDHFKIKDSCGNTVYVNMSYMSPPDYHDDIYVDLDKNN